MPKFQIYAQRERGNSAHLVKREVNGGEELADEEIYALEEDGYKIQDVHVFHDPIVRQQTTTPVRHHRGHH